MTQVKLIKRNTMTTPDSRPPRKTMTARETVQEWVNQYQSTKSDKAHSAFAALFAMSQIG